MALRVNLMFEGDCREAVTFYASALGLDLPPFITYGEGDSSIDPNVQMSDEGKDLIMHTSLDILGTEVVFNDMPDNFPFERGNSFGLTLAFGSVDEASHVFDRLSEGGQVFVPFGDIPGQGWFGMLGDRFNVSWTVTA